MLPLQAFLAVSEDPELVDPTPFNAKAVDEVGKRWRALGPGVGGGKGEDSAEVQGNGPSKNGLKTILNILKSICKDVSDFEQGLAAIIDRNPKLSLTVTPLESTWQLRAQSIKAIIRTDLDGALRAHQNGMGAVLLTFMTQAVRDMIRAPTRGLLTQEDVRIDFWAVLDFPSTRPDKFNDEKPRWAN